MATRTRHAVTVAPRLSVIVLVYNEVESITPLHEELIAVLDAIDLSYEVLYIDDGSRDGSPGKPGQFASRDPHVRGVSFRRNFGQTAAVQAGVDHSRGEILVFLDGDMQNDPHDIPRLLEKIAEGNDVVSGWRKDRRDDAMRGVPSRIANWVIARVPGIPLHYFGSPPQPYHPLSLHPLQPHPQLHPLHPPH